MCFCQHAAAFTNDPFIQQIPEEQNDQGAGKITPTSLSTRTSAILKKTSSQRATIQHLFEHFDEDSDGSLCLREFLQGFSYWKNTLTSTEDKLILFYNLFDKDKNGVMDREEFKQMQVVEMQQPPVLRVKCAPEIQQLTRSTRSRFRSCVL